MHLLHIGFSHSTGLIAPPIHDKHFQDPLAPFRASSRRTNVTALYMAHLSRWFFPCGTRTARRRGMLRNHRYSLSSHLLSSPLLSSPLLSSPLFSSPIPSSPLLSSPLLFSPLLVFHPFAFPTFAWRFCLVALARTAAPTRVPLALAAVESPLRAAVEAAQVSLFELLVSAHPLPSEFALNERRGEQGEETTRESGRGERREERRGRRDATLTKCRRSCPIRISHGRSCTRYLKMHALLLFLRHHGR